MSRVKRCKISCALAALLLCNPAAWAQTLGQRSLYFTVEEGDKLIGGLTEKNFRLYEEGQPVAFKLAEPESPILITLLVEYSQASGPYLSDIETALREFMEAAPEGNWYSLATFSQELQINVDFTKLKGEILAGYAGLGQPFWGEVNTYDAVFDTLEKLEMLPGRKVVIVIGSGLNSFSAHTLGDVQKKIEATNVTVFGLGAGSLFRGQYDAYLGTGARLELTQAEAFLNMLANKSGGQAFFPRFETAYKDIVRGVIAMLQNQYRILYESRVRPDKKFHRLKIEAFQVVDDKRRDFSVRVRDGWRWY
jgi:Ca-activated chloride channel family protein